MSNLGWYQWMTQSSKKVGGVPQFLLFVSVSGYIIGRTTEWLVRQTHKKLTDKTRVYTVNVTKADEQGLVFISGEQFRVLESDGDAILIEKIGNQNNPCFVSGTFLSTISNFKL